MTDGEERTRRSRHPIAWTLAFTVLGVLVVAGFFIDWTLGLFLAIPLAIVLAAFLDPG